MKSKGLSILLSFILLFTFTGCAGTTPAPSTAPDTPVASNPETSPQLLAVIIEGSRGAGRIGLGLALRRAGLSTDETANVITAVADIVDEVQKGSDVREVLSNPATWQPVRDLLVSRIAGVLVGVKVDGVPVYTQASAERFVGSLVDAFAATVRARVAN